MTDDLIARLRERDAEVQSRADTIIKAMEDADYPVTNATEELLRRSVYREAADEIERLRQFNDELRRYMYDRRPDRREIVCRKFMPEVSHD